MTKTVWITRTQPAADESAAVWREAGFDPIALPLLSVKSIEHDPLPLETLIVFTSKNAVGHFHGSGQSAVCVGDATADKARAAGFTEVTSVNGTSADLIKWIVAFTPPTRPICHVSGWHVRGSISEDLCARGFSATRLKVYRSMPDKSWPTETPNAVALYSPKAAQVFAEFAIDTIRDLSAMTAICISHATADMLRGLNLKSVLVAQHPREDAMIAAT